MRERSYVQMAKLNGMSTTEIIWREHFPEPAALSGGELCRVSIGGYSGINWSGGDWAGATERAYSRYDNLLGDYI